MVAKIEHPCVKCGKEGQKQLSGKWFCSHDCTGANLNDLTSQMKKLANPPQSAATAETQRVMDFLQKNIREPPSLPPNTATPSRPDRSTAERLMELLEKQNEAVSEPATFLPEATPSNGHDADNVERVMELLKKQGQAAKARPEGFRCGVEEKDNTDNDVESKTRQASWEAKENLRLASFVQAATEKPPHEFQGDDARRIREAQVKDLSPRHNGAMAAENALQNAVEQQVSANKSVASRTEVASRERKENARIAQFIQAALDAQPDARQAAVDEQFPVRHTIVDEQPHVHQDAVDEQPHVFLNENTKQVFAQIKALCQQQDEAVATERFVKSVAEQQAQFTEYVRGALRCESQKQKESDDKSRVSGPHTGG
eukprot:CAMPEP_0117523262 /NCGR_PEP_ID=MMETSP0784-20121206/34637_1 /TAXON_ID=39447 /ORGANISM="" /LENGTH=370 /DNA_ID=CAMNT_0005319369 /DNA_START=147 /DNA_END=1259 /DNA_ORIENTATION=-